MSDELRRNSNSNNHLTTIKFRQIQVDRQYYCHRSETSLEPDKLKQIMDSLVSEGQATPMTVAPTGEMNSLDEKLFCLIGGYRRYGAIEEAIRQQLDVTRLHEEMEIAVVIVERGPDQSEREFQQDLLIRSVAENEQRKNFETPEKLQIVKVFRDAGVPDPRAASAMCISLTQYGRFVIVIMHPWLRQLVVDNCIGMTDAAELIRLAEKHDHVEQFRRDLESWVDERRREIERERRELAKIGKELTGSAANVKKFIDKDLIKHWSRLIGQQQPFSGEAGFEFGILIDEQKGTITVPGRSLKVSELTSSDLETFIGELQIAVDKVLPLIRERRVIEESRHLSAEEKRQELDRISEELRRRQEAERQAHAGRPAEDFGVVPTPHLADVDVDDEEAADADPTGTEPASQTPDRTDGDEVLTALKERGVVEEEPEEAEDDTDPSPAAKDTEGETPAAEDAEDDGEDREEVNPS